MAELFNERMTAEIDGEFVVFLIGARINRPWKIHKWLPVALAMPRMIKELEADPSSGFLGAFGGPKVMVQYWRSFEHLERYARSQDNEHWPAWVAFNRKVRVASGDVGIWHETYRVAPGMFEAIYGAMPRFGLAKAARHVRISGRRDSARGRMEESAPPVAASGGPLPEAIQNEK
jgi:hypothetical protein